jgi:hypothetical protein
MSREVAIVDNAQLAQIGDNVALANVSSEPHHRSFHLLSVRMCNSPRWKGGRSRHGLELVRSELAKDFRDVFTQVAVSGRLIMLDYMVMDLEFEPCSKKLLSWPRDRVFCSK